MEYVKRKQVLAKLNICYQTLYDMAARKEIDTIKVGKNTLYNLDKYLREKAIITGTKEKIAYCRVSSQKQKPDLENQIKYMKDKFPTHTIIADIGSGINFNREGLVQIIEKAISGKIDELVIAYKDRLARFGYELIEFLITKYSKGKIVIVNQDEEKTPAEEMTKDIITIMNVYVAKMNGLRKYKKKIKDEINKTG